MRRIASGLSMVAMKRSLALQPRQASTSTANARRMRSAQRWWRRLGPLVLAVAPGGDSGFAVGVAWRRARCLADKMVNSAYLLTYPAIGKNDGRA